MSDELKVTERHLCIGCKADDNHPKVHVLYGLNMSTGQPDFAHLHHDCTEETPWHEGLMESENFRTLREVALSGTRGDALREHIVRNIQAPEVVVPDKESKTARKRAAKKTAGSN